MSLRVYSVHELGDGDGEPVLIKEGFSWPAFALAGLWALWHRLWLVALGLLLAEGALSFGLARLFEDAAVQATVLLGVAALIGGFANDLHRWTLERRGYLMTGIVTGPGADEALARFMSQDPI